MVRELKARGVRL